MIFYNKNNADIIVLKFTANIKQMGYRRHSTEEFYKDFWLVEIV